MFVMSTAPTVIAPPWEPPVEAGEEEQASVFEFPAATQTWIPEDMAALTAALMASTGEDEARDILMTEPEWSWELERASWLLIAKSIPATTFEDQPDPSEDRVLTPKMLALLATPRMLPAAVPET